MASADRTIAAANQTGPNADGQARQERARAIGELARADAAEFEKLWTALALSPDHDILRGPEIGLVMARGRAGGDGAAFNLGEVTVARCVVRLRTGEEGVAYALGRDKRKAHLAALCDALLQTDDAERVYRDVIEPLAASRQQRRDLAAREAAATRVEFFTLVRGEDA